MLIQLKGLPNKKLDILIILIAQNNTNLFLFSISVITVIIYNVKIYDFKLRILLRMNNINISKLAKILMFTPNIFRMYIYFFVFHFIN